MTQPAQQPPAGPPQQTDQQSQQGQQGGQQPPSGAPPATPAPNQQPQQPQQGQPQGQPASPQQPPPPYGWPPPPVPGQQQPYPQPYSQPPTWPAPYGSPAPTGAPSTPGQPPQQPPSTGDPGQGNSGDQGDGDQNQGYDLSRLPKAAREEIERLKARDRERDQQLKLATVSQHAHGVAGQHGVNPQALLGSLAWQQAAAQLDPAAPDYQQRLAWTVQAIAQQNPWMAAQPSGQQQPGQAPGQQGQPGQPPAASGGDFSAGTGAGVPITEQQLAQMSPEEIDKAFNEGKLKHLM